MIKQKTGWTFSVHPEEVNKILTWEEKHIKEKHNGNGYADVIDGRFSYEFTSILLVILVQLNVIVVRDFVLERFKEDLCQIF